MNPWGSGVPPEFRGHYTYLGVIDGPCRISGYAAIDRLIIGPDPRLYPCDAFKQIGAEELVKTEEWSCLAGRSLPDCWRKSPYLEAVRTYLTTDF